MTGKSTNQVIRLKLDPEGTQRVADRFWDNLRQKQEHSRGILRQKRIADRQQVTIVGIALILALEIIRLVVVLSS